MTDWMKIAEACRAAQHEILYEALLRWNIDEEIGGSSALSDWVDQFLDERHGP